MNNSWKDIPPVPTHKEFVDIVLSSTQRRLPTQIRAGFKISRIRAFYTRKVKFTAEGFAEKLNGILVSFPKMDRLHPFYAQLFNTLYDKDHYKIALSHLSGAKNTIETISRDYVRLLKYAQSLYQAKSLKRAALGRMATLMHRLKEPLEYLEDVRQHIGRLPSIDPEARTLLVFGVPNTGKSSFVRSVSRTDTPVDSYAFTTKSLFCGHFDFDYLRFQVIDTPGVVDKPLSEMTNIELQSLHALAHLKCAILFFVDPSEQCGYSLDAQCALLKDIGEGFKDKVVYLVSNKSDISRLQDLDAETREKLDALAKASRVAQTFEASCQTGDGIHEIKDVVCRRLIADRVAHKLALVSSRAHKEFPRGENILRRIHVARPLGPASGDNDEVPLPLRETFVPEGAKDRMKPERTERDLEAEQGGPGVYNFDLQRDYVGIDPEHQHDKMPEVYNGQNVLDFYSPDIVQKMEELEAEEERLVAEGYYDSTDEEDAIGGLDLAEGEDLQDILGKAEMIREKLALIRNENQMRKRSLKNNALIPRSILSKAAAHKNAVAAGRSMAGSDDEDEFGSDDDMMDVDDDTRERNARARADEAIRDMKSAKMKKQAQKKMNRMARQGEADRHIAPSLTKHLVAGKRGIGKTNRR